MDDSNCRVLWYDVVLFLQDNGEGLTKSPPQRDSGKKEVEEAQAEMDRIKVSPTV